MRLIRRLPLLAPAFFLTAYAGTIYAENASADPRTVVEAEFGTLDTNANQLIDRTEAQASEELQRNFDELDQNNDGQLSESEFSGFETNRSAAAVSDTKTDAISEDATPAKPTESWFTAPRHRPRADEPARGREDR